MHLVVDLLMADVVRLEYRNVTMRFRESSGRNELTAVQNVSFSVHDGEVVSLIGPSGCGKSTLLNIGSGLTAPTEGQAFVDGERVTGPNAHVAFMLQKDLLLPWRTIAENVFDGHRLAREIDTADPATPLPFLRELPDVRRERPDPITREGVT